MAISVVPISVVPISVVPITVVPISVVAISVGPISAVLEPVTSLQSSFHDDTNDRSQPILSTNSEHIVFL